MTASRRRWTSLCLVVAATAVSSAAAGPVAKITFTDTRLKNGLRVIISEDRAAPVVSVVVNYDVGSRDERKGRTGFAHLFEHMMFKGSENVGDGEHPYLVFMSGGSMNGTTNKERTMYWESLPSNQLDLALFLEADRMRSLAITKANLDNQRKAVQEERRLRLDNQPYGRTYEKIDELAFQNFGYQHSVIGSMADLEAASVEDVAAFFKTYYAPNNAVMVIVGDVEAKTALAKVRKYFDTIPSQPKPPAVDATEPPQTEERRATVDDPLARLTRIDMVYKTPPSNSPDQDALSVLSSILASGRSSRFYEAILRQKQLVSGPIGAGVGESRGPGLFTVVATVAPGKSAAEVEAAIDGEIERLRSGPIEPWEMEKARNTARAALVAGLGSSLNRAIQIGQFALFYNDPGRINTRADAIAKVTPADVQRVAKTYLVKTARTVVTTVPAPAAAPAKGAK